MGLFWLSIVLSGCGLQPVTAPRSANYANEPTPLPLPDDVEKPTYIVERGMVSEQLTLDGRVGSAVEIPIEANQSGLVSTVLAQNGAAVVEGDVLALLDTSAVDASLAAGRVALAQVEAQISAQETSNVVERQRAELALERANLLLATAVENNSSEAALRVLEIDVTLAELAMSQAQGEVDPELLAARDSLALQIAGWEQTIADAQIVSAADGDLIGFSLQQGSRVQAGTRIGALLNLDDKVVWATVDVGDMGLLAEGMPAFLQHPIFPDQLIPSTISQLPFPDGTGTIGFRENAIQLSPNDLGIMADWQIGERIEVAIPLAERADALWLPAGVIREFGGQSFVIVQDGDEQRRVDVEIGLVSGGRAEIVAGLREGMIVVAP